MDAPETHSAVGEPSRPSLDASSPVPVPLAPRPRPPHLGALYASPTGPTVLVYYPEHHHLGLPLMPHQLAAASGPPSTEDTEPLHFRILHRTDGGEIIEATVLIEPASLPAPSGDWVARPFGNWVVRVAHIG
jgi:hypothetical protein